MHQITTDLLCLLGSSHSQAELAQEALGMIKRQLPFCAASFSSWQPLTMKHETLVNVGYSESVQHHLNNEFVEKDEVYQLMRNINSRPLRWRDVPFEYREMHSVQSFFMPAGFNEGLSACLYTRDGRYTGCLHLSFSESNAPKDSAMQLLNRLTIPLAYLTDRLKEVSQIARKYTNSDEVGILLGGGNITHVSGSDEHKACIDNDDLITQLHKYCVQGHLPISTYWFDKKQCAYQINAQNTSVGVLVMLKEIIVPYHLTTRELEVLSALTYGHSTPVIAYLLGVSNRTIEKHFEHIMEKLGETNRTGTAIRAFREGLTVLPGLIRSIDQSK